MASEAGAHGQERSRVRCEEAGGRPEAPGACGSRSGVMELSTMEGTLSWAANCSGSCFREIILPGLQWWQEWQQGDRKEALPQGGMMVAWTRVIMVKVKGGLEPKGPNIEKLTVFVA